MNKKRQSVIILTVLLILCLFALTACNKQEMVNLQDYVAKGNDNLNLVGKLVKAMHEWIGSYGWTVVVFTVALKIVMIPFDLWQRTSTKKNSVKMAKIQPLIENIDKKYGANTQKANEEKQKLYKKQSVSTLSSCLPMLVTMAIFIFMFGGLNNYATYNNVMNYNQLQTYYHSEFTKAEGDAAVEVQYNKLVADGEFVGTLKDYCVKVASQGAEVKGSANTYNGIASYYDEQVKEEFLWMQSIWQPDTWDSIMPEYQKFSKTVSIGSDNPEREYNLIRNEVLKTGTRGEAGKWNGLMILPLLSVLLSFASMFITQKMERKTKDGQVVPQNDQQAQSNKMMMFLMPAMMAVFGFMYTGAFAVYMVCNYTLSILFTVALKKPIDKMVEKQLIKEELKEGSSKASYKR
ncbi:MAG: membrane protein insertase YidC [Clostridia bacterium]|nr:membrane protein insertase YidC [Clostridia bacterium]